MGACGALAWFRRRFPIGNSANWTGAACAACGSARWVILSARRRLVLSHVGRGIRDNNPIPPSVVVSELLDYVRRGWGNPSIVTPPVSTSTSTKQQ